MKKQLRFINTRSFIPRGFVLLVLPCLLAAAARDAALPGDARIDFNLACAAAADGDADRAVEMFQKAATSTDPRLAAASRYCLGCLAAIKAKDVFGEKPQDAEPEIRSQGLEHLDRAVAHYRDALKLDPQHEDTRFNLETIRHWVKQMNDLWRQRDRQKKRDALNLLDYVLMLEKEQQDIRQLSKTLATQTDTPLWREQLDELRLAQEDMAREIEPLKGKIVAALSKQQGGPGTQKGHGAMPGASPQPAAPDADIKKAVALLSGLADQAGTEMTTAADQLRSARTADALTAQAAAVEMLDQIYMAVAPYPGLVKRAVDTQRELVGRTVGVVEPPKTAENNMDGENPVADKPQYDPREEAWRQRFVTRWSEVMVAKAKQGLKQMPPPSDDKKVVEKKTDKKKVAAKPASGLDAKKKTEGLRKSMELAVKLGPKVETLTDNAAAELDEKRPVPALPKQKEALRLLEEIAKPLQDENKQDQQQDQDKKNKDQDKKNQDQKNKDQKQKQDDKKKNDKDKEDKKKDDQKKSSKDKKDKQKQKAKPERAKGQKSMTKDQKKAEAALRRARQRQQERRELEKALELQLHRAGTVEKDW